jgi:hypothetical protein
VVSELPVPVASRLKTPSWLDGRLVVGVLVVLVCIVVVAKIVASSGDYDRVWAASRDLAPGTTVTKGDLVSVQVRFHDHGDGYYAASGASLVGRTTVAPLSAGELIPVAALPATPPAPTRLVTVPVAKLHMPRGGDLRGHQVDLYVTVKHTDTPEPPRLVLANVTVADTVSDSSLGGSGGSGVVLAVPVAYVDDVVGAVESGSIDLVRVPAAETAAAPSPGTFAMPSSPAVSTPAVSAGVSPATPSTGGSA